MKGLSNQELRRRAIIAANWYMHLGVECALKGGFPQAKEWIDTSIQLLNQADQFQTAPFN